MRLIQRHGAFLLLLVLFVAASLAHQRALRVMEGSDEPLHYNYAELLRSENRLPDRATRTTNSTQQASGQPPLAYWIGSLWLRVLNLPSVDGDVVLNHIGNVAQNRWYSPHQPWNTGDNHNVYLHGRGETAFNYPDIVTTDRALRLLGTVWGVIALIGAYGAAREVFTRQSWALLATLAFALMPTMLHINSYVTNDSAATAFASLTVWGTLRLLRRGATPFLLVLIGLCLALAGLSKVNALLIAPGVGAALILDWRTRHISVWRLLVNGILLGIPLLILFAPWVVYGVTTYGDPFGFNTHQHLTTGFYFAQPRTLGEILPLLPHLYLSYWGWFATVPLEPITYTLCGVIAGMSAAGYILGTKLTRWSTLRQRQALVLSIMIIVVLLGMIRWMQQLSFTGGRLMYPAHVPITLALVGGLYLLARRFKRFDFPIRAYTAVVIGVGGVLLPLVAMEHAYGAPPMLQRDQLPALTGGVVDYDGTIRLLGIAQDSNRLTDNWHEVIACWEVLRETDRPAAFSLKFIRDGVIIADRTTIFGMGRYPSSDWRVGDIFCDTVSVPLDDPDLQDEPPPLPATVYAIIAVVLDAETLAVDWVATTQDGTPINVPIVGQVISPAGQMQVHPDEFGIVSQPTPTTIEFPNFARLREYVTQREGELDPGDHLWLFLLWDVTGETGDNWSQFTHVIGLDNGYSAVLSDGIPNFGAYPTWAWSAGEQIAELRPLSLPVDLPPGEYAIQTGFYRQDTGERMPVIQDGQRAANDSAVVMTFTVE